MMPTLPAQRALMWIPAKIEDLIPTTTDIRVTFIASHPRLGRQMLSAQLPLVLSPESALFYLLLATGATLDSILDTESIIAQQLKGKHCELYVLGSTITGYRRSHRNAHIVQ